MGCSHNVLPANYGAAAAKLGSHRLPFSSLLLANHLVGEQRHPGKLEELSLRATVNARLSEDGAAQVELQEVELRLHRADDGWRRRWRNRCRRRRLRIISRGR